MCEKAVEDEPEALELVPDHVKSLEICAKEVEKCNGYWNLSQIILRRRRCVKKQLTKNHCHQNLYQTAIKLKGCVTRWCRKDHT